MKTGLRVFAGSCNWREITDKEKTITCSKFESGEIAHGILVETGIQENTHPTPKPIEGLEEALRWYEDPYLPHKYSEQHMTETIVEAAKAYLQLTKGESDV
jgi:hypothetical protein